LIIVAIILTSSSNAEMTAKTYLKENNIYIITKNGTEKQLTFNSTDSDPIFIEDQDIVIFVRSEGPEEALRKIIMKVNIKDLSESVLTDKKPFEDALTGTHDIYNIYSPTLSLDGKYILFVTEKYVTGSQLVKVEINTGKWIELFSAESFEQIDKAPYKGYFLAGQSVIEDHGRDIYFRLINSSGRIIKKFRDEESMKQFKAGIK
ncbi:MAG: hypothetical protein ORN55_08960, partial [Chitinophagaceae bacterium]|nr:hypothetical protein [Chitinophagaceae bacterium]